MQSVVFNVPSRNYSSGNWGFKVSVNMDNKYPEQDISKSNNSSAGVLKISECPPVNPEEYCKGGTAQTGNKWEARHYIIEREKKWTTCSRCISTDENGNCDEREYYDCCRGSQSTFQANPFPKEYTERINLSGSVKSDKTNWNWQKGISKVNAGRGFEVKFELTYYTNRTAYPRTENRRSNGECGGDYTSPTYSSYLFTTPLHVKISGYNFPEEKYIDLTATSSGSWSNRIMTYQFNSRTDALGDVTRKFYTDMDTSNRTITFSAHTDKILGYARTYGESTGLNEDLIDCTSVSVRIEDGIGVEGKTNRD